MTVNVEGMSCTGCEARIEKAIGRMRGVNKVKANYKWGTVEIDGDVDARDVKNEIEDLGYKVTKVD